MTISVAYKIQQILSSAYSKGLNPVLRPTVDVSYTDSDPSTPFGTRHTIPVTVSFVQPASPTNGQRWLNPSNSLMQVYLTASTTWVPSTDLGVANPTPPSAVAVASLAQVQGGTNDVLAVTPKKLAQQLGSNWVSIAAYLTDLTGTIDQRAQLVQAFTDCCASGYTLVINVPVYIAIDYDYTRPIFVESNLNVVFTGNGRFITDNAGVPFLSINNSSNIKFKDMHITWQGLNRFPTDTPYITSPAATWVQQAFNDITLRNYMINNRGVTIASGSMPTWNPAGIQAVLHITGSSSNIEFDGLTVDVPLGTPKERLCPWVSWLSQNAKTGVTVTTNSSLAQGDFAHPSYIKFRRVYLDGFYMGFQGEGDNISFHDVTTGRFCDNYLSDGSAIRTQAPPPHLFYMQLNNSVITDVKDIGTFIGDNLYRGNGGYINSLKLGGNDNVVDGYVSFRRDGILDVLNSCNRIMFRNMYCVANTSLHVANNNAFVALRLPNGPYTDLTFDNIVIIDQAPYVVNAPFSSNGSSANARITLNNVKVQVNDFQGSTGSSTVYPAIYFAGQGHKIDVDFVLLAHTSTSTNVGVACFLGANNQNLKNVKYNARIIGWRDVHPDYANIKPRILAYGAGCDGVYVTQYDQTNAVMQVMENGIVTETFTDAQDVTPLAGTTQIVTGLLVPAGMTVADFQAKVITAFGTTQGLATGFNVGFTGSLSAIGSVAGIASGTKAIGSPGTASSGSDRYVVFSAQAGTFDGTGTIKLTVRSTSKYSSD